jgi:hypothetical protein
MNDTRQRFNHVRQLLMCFANITVEGANPDSDKSKLGMLVLDVSAKTTARCWSGIRRIVGPERCVKRGGHSTAMSNDGVGASESNRHTPAM